ncbi:hypothetical protein ATCC90586_001111 [Pythium insidiosum]|nr:hypothetical protein ATCC90586_001111 [Pythium insidiosum]
MARIEELPAETANAMDRWRKEQEAKALDREIQQLKVAMGELDTVRPKKTTYVRKANVFFLERRDVIVKTKRNELQSKEQKRVNIGLELRSTSS